MDPPISFGLYFIPRPGNLYDAGSRLLGYDIRANRNVVTHGFVDPGWTADAAAYGFHVSITDAIEIAEEKLSSVIGTVQDLLSCFTNDTEYTFTNAGVTFWDKSLLVLELSPNRSIEMLHDVLVARIHPLGSGSAYTSGGLLVAPDSPESAKLRLFHSPYIFDAYRPHFTCLQPFTGTDQERHDVQKQANELFASYSHIRMGSLALVTKQQSEEHYHIHTEFSLN
jgi:hypothetical protein